MNRFFLTLLILAVLVGIIYVLFVNPIFLGPGGPNLVLNGSFEAGNIDQSPGENVDPACQCKLICGGSNTVVSWQITKPLATAQTCEAANDAVAWVPVPNPLHIGAQDGNRFLDLTGDANRPPSLYGSIQQTVEGLQPGRGYELSFALGSSSGFPPPRGANGTQFYTVILEAPFLSGGQQPFAPTAPTPDLTHWDQHSLRFTATAQAVTIKFSASGSEAGGLGGAYIGIDNVSLRRVCFLGPSLGCS